MRKIIVAVIMTIFITSAFAANEEISPAVETAFKAKFPGASAVEWTKGSTYYKASFTNNGKVMFAFYSEKAELLGLMKYVRSTQLPPDLQSKLKPYFKHYWITDLFEMSNRSSVGYYVTFRNADNEIVLESCDGSDWKLLTVKTGE
jgi:hypothetical protein